jgi:hypothetical protein
MSYEGTNTTVMVYGNFPIIDYFHFVTPDLVYGLEENESAWDVLFLLDEDLLRLVDRLGEMKGKMQKYY